MKIKKIALWVFILIIGIIFVYIWYGFLFPDPFYVSNFSFSGKLKYLWLPRILIPLIYFVLILLIVMKNRKTAQNITITIAAIFIMVLIAYPVLDIMYYSESQSKNKLVSEQYHPYLQLNPILATKLDSIPAEGAYKIFCLGGSTTENKDSKGIGWTDRLEKELREVYDSDSIYVFNFGRQWYTTLHSLINYEANLRQYKPDVIILMHNINDLLQNANFSYLSKGQFREDYGHFMGPSANIFRNNGLFGSYMNYFKQTWYSKPRITFEQDSFPGLEPFTRNINTLIDLAIIDSTKVILLTQPNIFSENMNDSIKRVCTMINYEAVGKVKRWGYQTGFSGMNQYNQRIKAISENRDVYFIDLEKYIPKSLVYFYDEVHYTDTTFNIISKVIVEDIVKSEIILH
jgi:hypothetical protein